MKDDLALFGGDPIKKDEYQIHTTMIDSKEELLVFATSIDPQRSNEHQTKSIKNQGKVLLLNSNL